MSGTHYPRSPKVLLGGMAHVARLIDKIRLRHVGNIPDYNYLTTGFDKAFLQFVQVEAAAFEQRVLAGGTDEEILHWLQTNGRPLPEAEIRLWTRQMLSAKPEDAIAAQRFRDRLAEVAIKRGVPIESLPPVGTWVEAIDLDEERL